MSRENDAMVRCCALACYLGFTPEFDKDKSARGTPVILEYLLGSVRVLPTARGFRVAQLDTTGVFLPEEDRDFHRTVAQALHAGKRRADALKQ